jgi:hypothetical protein
MDFCQLLYVPMLKRPNNRGEIQMKANFKAMMGVLAVTGLFIAMVRGSANTTPPNDIPAEIAVLQAQVAALQANNAVLIGPYITLDQNPENGLAGPNIIFHNANVHIESGSGSTVDTTGRGNLVIGYNSESITPLPDGTSCAVLSNSYNRTGSHNLIIGDCHQFMSSGGLVAGIQNTISGPYSSVSGGALNTASGDISSVSGGDGNNASAEASSVSGGQGNNASGLSSSVSGGVGNHASAEASSVSGGNLNIANQNFSSVSGGQSNNASGLYSSVSGGNGNNASGKYSSVGGGDSNTASGQGASVNGGGGDSAGFTGNTASGQDSSIGGGYGNMASGQDQDIP